MAIVLEGTLHVLPVDNTGKPTGAAVKLNNHATDSISWSGDSKWLLYLNNGELKMVSRDGRRTRDVPLELDVPQRRRPEPPDHPRRQVLGRREPAGAGRTSTSRWSATASRASGRTTGTRARHEGGRRLAALRHARALGHALPPRARDPLLRRSHQPGAARLRHDLDAGARRRRLQLGREPRGDHAPGLRVGPRGFASGEPIDGARTHLDHFRGVVEQRRRSRSRCRGCARCDYDYLKTYVRTSAPR